jgi:tetratricopeptide (TPR) repeat protein
LRESAQEEPEMKVRTSFLLGLIFLMSIMVSAQSHQQRGLSPREAEHDPFDNVQLQTENIDNQLPFNNNAPATYQNTDTTTVSLQQLQHRVPQLAYKEFKKGCEAFLKGSTQAAIEHLQNAIKIDPEFADAHNDLGVIYLNSGRLEQGETEFQKATALAPYHNTAVSNLAIALFVLGRYHEACPFARRALKINPPYPYLLYVLGLSIISEHGDKTEALDNLQRAGQRFPGARVAASKLLAEMGQPHDAAGQLTEYLRSAPKQDATREQVEAQLPQLRR